MQWIETSKKDQVGDKEVKPIRSGKETLPVGIGRAARAKIIIDQKCKVHSSQYLGRKYRVHDIVQRTKYRA